MDFYDLNYYKISVTKEKEKIFEISSGQETCGLNSFCVPNYYDTITGPCNVGRVETEAFCEDFHGLVSSICCKEDKEAYETREIPSDEPDEIFPVTIPIENFPVIECGPKSEGVCSAEPNFVAFNAYIEKFPCGEGRVEVEDPTKRCKDVNDGKTPICCAPTDVGLVTTGRAFSAIIPILYKGEQAILEVSIK